MRVAGDGKGFSARVRAARNLAPHLSQRELDRLAGLTPGHTSAIEAGRRANVGIRIATEIARVLGASLDWLVRGEGEGPTREAVAGAVSLARAADIPLPPASGPALPSDNELDATA